LFFVSKETYIEKKMQKKDEKAAISMHGHFAYIKWRE
jgi:hypothetical protein